MFSIASDTSASEIHDWRLRRKHLTLHMRGCGVRLETSYSRGLTILKGAVPGRVRGSGYMAPTYFCRLPGSKIPTAIVAPHCPISTLP